MGEARILDLSPELRLLAQFLETDDRPSAIVSAEEEEEEEEEEVIYENLELRHLGYTRQSTRDLVTGCLRDSEHSNGTHAHGGRLWKCRRLRDGWNIIIAIGEAPHTTERPDVWPGRYYSASLPPPTGLTGSEPLDWTQPEVKSPDQWIDFIRGIDWSSTAVGPMDEWPPQLRHCIFHIMQNPQPRLVVWGESMTLLYNQHCVPLFGKKHPHCFGQSVNIGWPEAWPRIGPMVEDAFQGTPATKHRMPLEIERNGFLEDTYWDLALLPLLGTDGRCIGLVDEFTESTHLVRGERRQASTLRIAEALCSAATLDDLWSCAVTGLESDTKDVPFALIYAVRSESRDGLSASTESMSRDSSSPSLPKVCVLKGSMGVAKGNTSAVESFPLEGQSKDIENGPSIIQACRDAWHSGKQVVISSADGTLPPLFTEHVPNRSDGHNIRMAVIRPLMRGHDIAGFMILGLNPLCPYDEGYHLWIWLIADILENKVNLITLPEEQRRARQTFDDVNDALTQQLRMTTLLVEQSEERFRKLAESSPIGMFMYEADGKCITANEAYLKLLGDTREQHEARRWEGWEDRIHPDNLEKLTAARTSLLEQKVPVTVEYRLKRPWVSIDQSSGKELIGETWVLSTAFPDLRPDGKVNYIQGWLTDISHRKFSERLLSQRLEDALETKRQTENFIDMITHEMRNPLSAILQSADAIVSGMRAKGVPIPDENMTLSADAVDDIINAAETIILCAQHQKRITDDILTLSKLDSSLMVISPDCVQPRMLISKAMKMYKNEIMKAGITATICFEESYAAMDIDYVVLDSSRFLQVVINLLTNAIKFTRYSETRTIRVCIGASLERPTVTCPKLAFIPERNARSENASLPELGDGEELYLQVAVYDSGQGLTETQMKTLFQRFSQASPKTYKQYGGSGLGLFISRELCELQGGQIGVSSVPGQTMFKFFVVTRRSTHDLRRKPSLLGESNECCAPKAAGSVTEEAASARRSSGHSKEKTGNATTEDLNILLVEDNAINQKVMSKQLRKEGCNVHVANHGLECLTFLEGSTFCGAATPISVILLDLEMPVMDGLTCIRQIRERQRDGQIDSHVPVIAVTANARSEQISVALDAGMDQVVTKPFRISELMPQLRGLIADVRRRQGS